MFVDINVESLELIQPDTIGAPSVVPYSQMEAILEERMTDDAPMVSG